MLRSILVGCGGMGNNWANLLKSHDDIDIVGVVDVDTLASNRLVNRVGIHVPQFTNLEPALEQLKPDVVLDTAIPETRRQIAGMSMQAGCDVLSEKPLACSVQEAQELVELTHETGKTHAVMQNRRYLAGTQQCRDLIQSDAIGKLGMVCADFFIGAHFEGFRLEMDHVLLLDMAIHTFDQARFMMGLDCEAAYCKEFNLPGSWYQGGASALCIFEMQQGVQFCYRGSWTAEGANTTWESTWRFIGEKGTVVWDGKNTPYAEIVDSDEGFMRKTKQIQSHLIWRGPSAHAGCLAAMVHALHIGAKPMTHSGDNAKSLGMVFAAIESSKSGRAEPVRL